MQDNKKNGIWLDELLCEEKLKGTELQLRNVNRYCDELGLHYRLTKHLLSISSFNWEFRLLKYKQGKFYIIYQEHEMELEILLKKAQKFIKQYYKDHKEVVISKGGINYL